MARRMVHGTLKAFAITAGLSIFFSAGWESARAEGIDWRS